MTARWSHFRGTPLPIDWVQEEGAEEANRPMTTREVSCLLLDIQLPGMDGFEVHRMLCADPETSHIPVLACTAFRDEDMNRRLAESAFAGVVEKPLDWATFAAEVRAHLT